jgi:hypothetical protein
MPTPFSSANGEPVAKHASRNKFPFWLGRRPARAGVVLPIGAVGDEVFPHFPPHVFAGISLAEIIDILKKS